MCNIPADTSMSKRLSTTALHTGSSPTALIDKKSTNFQCSSQLTIQEAESMHNASDMSDTDSEPINVGFPLINSLPFPSIKAEPTLATQQTTNKGPQPKHGTPRITKLTR
ncbi:unnamed protein product [Dicrocoelium dendriticum]|nr:unnamed protein product [Dicrocoelium dendriticum]